MTRHLAAFALAAIALFSSRVVLADVVFDTVDAVQTSASSLPPTIRVTGIISGQSSPTTHSFAVGFSSSSADVASRCDRLALLALSKPGKFQLVMVAPPLVSTFECKLVLRAP
jgi:hypothetical protein